MGYTEVTDSRGMITQYYWLPTGQVTREIDPLGRTKQTEYDQQGRIIATIAPNGGKTSYEFDDWGNRCKITDPLGHPVAIEYNSLQVIREIGFDRRELTFEYDAAGDWVATINGIGERISYQRDLLGRLLVKQLPDGNASQFKYDHFGNLIVASNADCKVTFERDAVGRVTKECQDDDVIEHRYDLAGNLIETKTSLGHQVAYRFDGNGALTSLTVDKHKPIQFERNARGEEIARWLPSGIKLSQEYDQVGQLVVQQVNTSERQFALPKSWKEVSKAKPKSPAIRREYQYDKASNLT